MLRKRKLRGAGTLVPESGNYVSRVVKKAFGKHSLRALSIGVGSSCCYRRVPSWKGCEND